MRAEIDAGTEQKIEIWHIDQLIPYDRNPRKITPAAVQKVARSIAQFGMSGAVVVDEDGVILAGHTRREALLQLGATDVPVIVKHGLTDAQKRAYRIMDNRAGEESEWDENLLQLEVLELTALGDFDIADLGFDADEFNKIMAEPADEPEAPAKKAKAAKADAIGEFDAMPSSIIDARGDWWAARAQLWADELKLGQGVFDPVLAELAYRWFCPPGGIVIDPFAGDAVRGLVASQLGRSYHGIDLDSDVIAANVETLEIAGNPAPSWYGGDALELGTMVPRSLFADMLFIDVPRPFLAGEPGDLAGMGLLEHQRALSAIVEAAAARLKPCRFAFVVVDDVRAPDGSYAGLPWRVVELFGNAGLQLYNDAVHIPVPNAALQRADFDAAKRLDRDHRHVFVFVKGDPGAAARDIGPSEHGKR